MPTSTNHSPADNTMPSRALVLFLVLGFLVFGHAVPPDRRQRSRVRTNAFPGWPPNLPPNQYATFLATWYAHQRLLHKSLQKRDRYSEPWRPLYQLWKFGISLLEWAVTGTSSILNIILPVFPSISSCIIPVTAFTVYVFALVAFALVATLVVVITAGAMFVSERQMQQRSRKRSMIIQVPAIQHITEISSSKNVC
ncbi:hypothetical protein N7494_011688 [Penicillium frequentans]|uniref:Transmembrane protein n=1 Tax=Penicillium frequentans TaxID=3151616 RepID=A0AAD6CKY7_9EURO|nr:hypothetical protein N7494_011688 [Penicillium glabrum]